jgi:DNA-directed RNA polymerase alpha subunit
MLPKNPTLLSKILRCSKDGMSIAELEYIGLPLRVINSLEESKYRIIYIKDLISLDETQIASIENLGNSGIKQITKAFNNFHLLEEERKKWE